MNTSLNTVQPRNALRQVFFCALSLCINANVIGAEDLKAGEARTTAIAELDIEGEAVSCALSINIETTKATKEDVKPGLTLRGIGTLKCNAAVSVKLKAKKPDPLTATISGLPSGVEPIPVAGVLAPINADCSQIKKDSDELDLYTTAQSPTEFKICAVVTEGVPKIIYPAPYHTTIETSIMHF